MLYFAASLLLPPLLVFGLYHMVTWFNLLQINEREYRKRIALVSTIAHLILATGFFFFAYIDYKGHEQLAPDGLAFGSYVFTQSQFWRVMIFFDTAPTVVTLGLFSVLDRFQIDLPGLLPLTIGITFVVGSLQWYLVGGGVGAALERFWSSLKTGDDEDENWL